MPAPIFSSKSPVVFVGAGEFSPNCLTSALTYSRDVVAADGGANACLKAGITPRVVIGDFDSIDDSTRYGIPPDRLHHVGEQDSTDFEKCLTRVDAPLILATGFAGGRMDHALAVLGALVKHADRPCILIGPDDIAFHAPPALSLDLAPDTRVSLFPMRDVRGQSEGLHWPIDGLAFHPADRIGTSNRATGPVRLRFDGAGMLVILPPEHLGTAVAALTG